MESLITNFLLDQSHFAQRTIINYESSLKKLSHFLNQRQDFTDNDIKKYFNTRQFKAYKTSTQNREKSRIKVFLEWQGKNTSFIKLAREKKKYLAKKDLLTKEDIDILLNNVKPEYQTLIMILLEGKLRIDEARNLKIKDFENCGSHYNIHVRISKTNQRAIPLIESVSYIINHLNSHPLRNDLDFNNAYFFVVKYGGSWRQYSRQGFYHALKRKEHLIKKRLYPHLFRHTGLTQAAKFLSDSQLKQIAGWESRSMIDRYVHLASDDLEETILSAYNMQPKKKVDPIKIIENLECPRCNHTNPGTNKFCGKCGSALNINLILKYKEVFEKYKNNKQDLIALFEEFIEGKLKKTS